MSDTDEKSTTVRVYESDHRRLKRHLLRASDQAGRQLTMPEVVRRMIDAIEAKAEQGE